MECALAQLQSSCRLLHGRYSPRSSAAVLVTLFSLAACRCAPAADDVLPDHAERMAASSELFKSHVRGLLADHCLKCHGGKETHGEFDLSTREGLLKGGEQGISVVAGKPDESLLVKLVRHESEPFMPHEADKLPAESIEHISTWIATGAAYDKPLVDVAAEIISKTVSDKDRQFWSFQPLNRPEPPQTQNDAWCRTPIDRFILAPLESQGLAPNGRADPRKLIRRAYFDLIGLPPTPDEVEQFVADTSDDAYDRLVDRLLNSPHYGERWGRHWLDLARFAESHGYEQDDDRPTAYHYRDFVIRALNDDMPYDQFVRWQIAGDEFEPDNNLALMATGFLAAGTHATQITANQVEKERYDELDDMAATLGTAMLGLTVGCARCHDHKFDPIPQADYYRLVSTFTTAVRSEVDLDFQPEVYAQAKGEFDGQHAPLVEALERFDNEQLASRFESWLTSGIQTVMPTWLIVEVADVKSEGGAKLEKQDDRSLLASGNNASHDVYTIVVPTPVTGITAVRLEALAHDSLPKHGPGRADNGNFALSDFQLWAAPSGTAGPGAPVKLINPKVTFEQKDLPITSAIDDNKASAWAVDPQIGQNHAAAFALEPAVKNADGTTLTFILKFENNTGHNLGRLRLAISTVTEATRPEGDEAQQAEVDKVNAALAKKPDERSDEDRATLLAWYRPRDPERQKLAAAVAEHLKQTPQPKFTKVMITSEGLPPVRLRSQGADFFEHTYFLKRGDLNQKLTPADQSFLQVLMRAADHEKHWQQAPPEGWRTSYRRRALANWITDVDSGAGQLAARVIVNRLWQHHLGSGIVATPSDFGSAPNCSTIWPAS
jgi:mono/diheme cytochrome c family protein